MTRENTVNVPRDAYLRDNLDVVLRAVEDMAKVGIEVAKAGPNYHTEGRDRARIEFVAEVCRKWAALSAVPLHEGEGEPVAYEIRNRVGGDWKRVHHALYCSALDRPNLYEARPLYAAPPPSVPRMLVDQEWLARRVENEPEVLDCEVVPPSVEVERLREALAFADEVIAANGYGPGSPARSQIRAALSRKQEPGVPTPGDWVEWSGGENPVPETTLVDVKLRYGEVLGRQLPGVQSWLHVWGQADIIAYRIVPTPGGEGK